MTGIGINPATRVVVVTVSADLSSLIPGILPFQGVYQITGTDREARKKVSQDAGHNRTDMTFSYVPKRE